jgi:hypothetical protein
MVALPAASNHALATQGVRSRTRLRNGRVWMKGKNWFVRLFGENPWHLIAAAFFAVSVYVLDTWIWSLPIASFIVLLTIVPCFFIASLLCVFRRCRPVALKVLACIVVSFLGVVATVAARNVRTNLTQRRITKLGDACLAYRAKYSHYPDRLEELAPEFVSSVPESRAGDFSEDAFGYSSHDGSEPFIYYHCLPPFGVCYYYVESRSWRFMD